MKHYLKYNGGIPDKTFFYSDASEVETNVRTFLPMKYRDEADLTLEELYLDLKNRGVIPSNYLPFALDYGDNIFCVNLDNRQVVIIYLEESDVITEDEIDFLTNDFKEFLNSLESA